MTTKIKAPFPYCGGKTRVSSLVWERLGNPTNYVEPFAGSMAVLLNRPTKGNYETVNDRDGLLVNAWRSIKFDPKETAKWAYWPSSEADLHARHKWLLEKKVDLIDRITTDPWYIDPQIAGIWLWGLSNWIGTGWGSSLSAKRPAVNRRGVLRTADRDRLPEYFQQLSERLTHVRILCRDFATTLTPALTTKLGVTGVFLDPPYCPEAGRTPNLYTEEDATASRRAYRWAIEHAEHPSLRIAFCEYDQTFDFPSTWTCVSWKTDGGLAKTGDGPGKANAARERIWFSPHCLEVEAEANAA